VFARSARIYDAVYAWKDYGREAVRVHELVQARKPGAATLLDVACGTGAHLAELRRWYRCEGLDLDSDLLAVARERPAGRGVARRRHARLRPGAPISMPSSSTRPS